MVQYLEGVQTRDRVSFNKAAIRQCGIVVGFLERPIDDETLSDYFLNYDVILNMSDRYFSMNKVIFFCATELILLLSLAYNVFR